MHAKHNHKHSKTWMQHVMMKLNAKLSKLHIEHSPNGATVQHIHPIQVSNTIRPKLQLALCNQGNNMLQGTCGHKHDILLKYRLRASIIIKVQVHRHQNYSNMIKAKGNFITQIMT